MIEEKSPPDFVPPSPDYDCPLCGFVQTVGIGECQTCHTPEPAHALDFRAHEHLTHREERIVREFTERSERMIARATRVAEIAFAPNAYRSRIIVEAIFESGVRGRLLRNQQTEHFVFPLSWLWADANTIRANLQAGSIWAETDFRTITNTSPFATTAVVGTAVIGTAGNSNSFTITSNLPAKYWDPDG